MDYKPLIKSELDKLLDIAQDLSFGQIVFSIFRSKNIDINKTDEDISFLLTVEDKDVYTSLEKVIKEEKEYLKN